MRCFPARSAWPPATAGSASTRPGWHGPGCREDEKRPVPTPAEVREALATSEREDPTFGLFLRLCATTGLRAGEVCALRWCDLDLEAGELSVSGNVVHVSGGQILVGSTTTRSARSVMERKTTWWRPALRKAKTSTG
jgi:integrase